MIPYGKQSIIDQDITAVVEVLQSDWLTQGPMVPRFEEAVAKKVNAHFAVAVNSATSALHIACLALDLRPGDWLWTSPNTFVASANCALYCGAKIDFVDIDPQTYNMSVEALRIKLEQSERLGKLPKIVVPVHFAGQACEMFAMHQLAKQYGFKIIEDASHAIGGLYQNQLIGSCLYSDITIFSFHPVKIITTGEGGMALTNNPELAAKLQLLRSHGITREPKRMQADAEGDWYYEQLDLGFNYRMTDIQAALGISQLNRLDEFVSRRHYIASVYNKALPELHLVLPWQHDDTYSAWHLYVIQVDVRTSLIKRKELFDRLRKAGIGVNVHYIPVHLHPYYQRLGFSEGQFPQAEAYYHGVVSLPMYATLSEAQQEVVIKQVYLALEH